MAVINIINNQGGGSNYYSEDISDQIVFDNLDFQSTNIFKTNTLEVFLNGILLKRDRDYSEGSDFKSFNLNIPEGMFNKYMFSGSTLIIKYLIA